MTKPLFGSRGLRVLTLMVLFLGVSSYVNAQQVEGVQTAADSDGLIIIDAVVTEVEGAVLKLEGGLSIDISNARLYQISFARLDRSVIKPGTCIRAIVRVPSNSPAPLLADEVRIRVPNEIMLAGLIQASDLQVDDGGQVIGGSVTILNQKVVLPRGTFFGFRRKALKVGASVLIVANANETGLTATLVLPGGFLPRFVP